jgi:hypothetical protein
LKQVSKQLSKFCVAHTAAHAASEPPGQASSLPPSPGGQ